MDIIFYYYYHLYSDNDYYFLSLATFIIIIILFSFTFFVLFSSLVSYCSTRRGCSWSWSWCWSCNRLVLYRSTFCSGCCFSCISSRGGIGSSIGSARCHLPNRSSMSITPRHIQGQRCTIR